jgi:hypothetical protein
VDKKLYLLTGHGELDAEQFGLDGFSSAAGLLRDQGFTVEPLNLFITGAIPEDATVLAIVGPRGPIEEAEAGAIAAYLDAGGSLFVARDLIDLQGTLIGSDDPLARYLQEAWGVALREDIIIDPDMARAGQTSGLDFLGASFGASPIITDDLRRFGVRFSVARSIATSEGTEVFHTPWSRPRPAPGARPTSTCSSRPSAPSRTATTPRACSQSASPPKTRTPARAWCSLATPISSTTPTYSSAATACF